MAGGTSLAAEVRQLLRSPYDVHARLLVNLALTVGAWFLMPRAWFFELTDTAAFPLLLVSWLYSDTTATNLLAPDRDRVLVLLQAPGDTAGALVRLLRTKVLALWLLSSVPCLAAAGVTDAIDRHPLTTAATAWAVVALPLGPLSVASAAALLWPFIPRPTRWRWRHRRNPGQLRWLLLVTLPYLVIPLLLGVVVAPSLLLWTGAGNVVDLQLRGHVLLGMIAIATLASLVLFLGGQRLCLVLARARGPWLRVYLDRVDAS